MKIHLYSKSKCNLDLFQAWHSTLAAGFPHQLANIITADVAANNLFLSTRNSLSNLLILMQASFICFIFSINLSLVLDYFLKANFSLSHVASAIDPFYLMVWITLAWIQFHEDVVDCRDTES